MKQTSKRLFLGIPLNDILKKELINFQLNQYYDPAIRWIDEENFHVTLVFIGNIENIQLTSLKELVQRTLKDYKSFELDFLQFEQIPKNQPRMIWGRFNDQQTFTEIVINLQLALELKPEYNLKPHITLARFKNDTNQQNIHLKQLEINKSVLKVNKIHLYESYLTPAGSKYNIIDTYFLGS